MKKTIIVILASILIMSTVASAGLLDWFSGDWDITGAPTLELAETQLEDQNKVSFGKPLEQNTFLSHNSEVLLDNDVTVSSSGYNRRRNTVNLKFTKEIRVSDNQELKSDLGKHLAKVSSGYISLNNRRSTWYERLRPQSKAVVDTASTKNFLSLLCDSCKVPFGRSLPLSNGVSVSAQKEIDGSYTIIYTKQVTVTDNTKLIFNNGYLFVKVAQDGVSFTPTTGTVAGKLIDLSDSGADLKAGTAIVTQKEDPTLISFENLVSTNTVFQPGKSQTITTGLIAQTTYVPAKKSSFVTLTMTENVKDGNQVIFDDGKTFLVTVNDGDSKKLGFVALTSTEKSQSLQKTVAESVAVKSLLFNIHTPHNIQYGKTAILGSSYRVSAYKTGLKTAALRYSKTIELKTGSKLVLPGKVLKANVAADGKVSFEEMDWTQAEKEIPSLKEIAIPLKPTSIAGPSPTSGFAVTTTTTTTQKETLSGVITESTALGYNRQTPLSSGYYIYTIYTPTTNTAKGLLTKTIIVSNKQQIQYETGTFTVTVNTPTTGNGYVLLTSTNKGAPGGELGEELDLGCLQPPTSMKIPFGTNVALNDGYTAFASKTAAGTASLKLSRTINFVNGGQVILPDRLLKVNVLATGVSFTIIVGQSDNPTLTEIAIPQSGY